MSLTVLTGLMPAASTRIRLSLEFMQGQKDICRLVVLRVRERV